MCKNGIKDACSTVDIFNGCFICVYPFYLFYMFYLLFSFLWLTVVGTRDAYAPNKQYNFGTRLTLTWWKRPAASWADSMWRSHSCWWCKGAPVPQSASIRTKYLGRWFLTFLKNCKIKAATQPTHLAKLAKTHVRKKVFLLCWFNSKVRSEFQLIQTPYFHKLVEILRSCGLL